MSEATAFEGALKLTLTTCMVVLYTILRSVVSQSFTNKNSYKIRFVLDTITIAIPLTVLYTVGDDYNVTWNGLLSLLVLLTLLFKYRLRKFGLFPNLESDYTYENNKTYITCFRSYVTLSTIICILAVDFKGVFPRRHGKSYHFGYSLMDTGVGSFIFMAGLVSPEARSTVITEARSKMIRKSLVSSSVLIVIGLLRTVIVRLIDYSISYDEYGRDWNFFLTLASVKILSSLFLSLYPHPKKSWALAALIILLYQTALSKFGLLELLEDGIHGVYNHNDKDGLINANREGLFSTIGMLSLYFAGLSLGSYLFTKRGSFKGNLKVFGMLCLIGGSFWVFTFTTQTHIQGSSRCFANITYVAWSVAHNTTLLAALLLTEIIFYIINHTDGRQPQLPTSSASPSSPPDLLIPGGCGTCFYKSSRTKSQTKSEKCACLISAISKNQLAYFLLGNMLTGLVNTVAKPHSTPGYDQSEGMLIILGYIVIVNGLVSFMFVKGILLKFW